MTGRRTSRASVYPATPNDSREKDLTLPRMGDRFGLKKDFEMMVAPGPEEGPRQKE